MTRKHFTEGFRKEAVRLALNSDLSRHQVADILGLGIQRWASGYRQSPPTDNAAIFAFKI